MDAFERVRRGMGNYPIPVVLLARLAVVLRDQERGVGMLQDAILYTLAIVAQAGVRALVTHPIDNSTRFCLRFGFEPCPICEQQFLLLLKEARKLLS